LPQRKPDRCGEVRFFTSRLLSKVDGLTHAFPCRAGSSTDTINDLVNRLIRSFGMKSVLTLKQAHSAEVVVFDGKHEDAWKTHAVPADAVITRTRGAAVGVRTADCVPILVVDPIHCAVGAIHGGWRGLAAGVVGAAVERMKSEYSSDPRSLIAAIGPHVMSCCYEVGPEVAAVFKDRFGKEVLRPGKSGRYFLDLGKASQEALINAGLSRKNIEIIRICTCCNEDLFYSYRREGHSRGRQLSFAFFR